MTSYNAYRKAAIPMLRLSDLLHLARALARVKHSDQVRKGPKAEPYFNHAQRVANRSFTYASEAGLGAGISARAELLGYLHDLVEDTNLTPLELRHVGFDWTTVDDVVGLSREQEEAYFDFIDRGTRDLTVEGLIVKLADLHDNLSDDWGGHSLRARYIRADAMVRAELKRQGVDVARMANPNFLRIP